MNTFLFWTPRVLCILFALFLSIFSFDVFGQGLGFWQTALAFLIHLVPVFLVIAALLIAWKREWLGAILFIALAVLYVVWGWGKFPWTVYAVICGPLAVISILFLINWLNREGLQVSNLR